MDAVAFLSNLIFGISAICLGLLIVRYKKTLNDLIYLSQKKMFGRKAAQASAGRQTPFMMGVVGVLATIIGCVVVVGTVIELCQLSLQ